MKKTMKILIPLVFFVISTLLGIMLINMQQKIDLELGIFTETKFDYLLSSPSEEQLNEFSSNKEAVNSIFPVTNFKLKLSGKRRKEMNLFLAKNLEFVNTGFFNENLSVKGKFKEDGIMLDKNAADFLDVNINDKVSFMLNGKSFTLKVAGIYIASTYNGFEKGIALAKMTEEMENVFIKKIKTNMAFIEAKNSDLCDEMLKNYKPLGNLLSQDEYMSDFKAENECPGGLTEEEWDRTIIVAYNKYKESFLSKKYDGLVQHKIDYLNDVKDQVKASQKQLTNALVFSIIMIILVYVISNSVLMFSNKKIDKTAQVHGEDSRTFARNTLLYNCLIPAIQFILTFGILFGYSMVGYHSKDVIKMVISCPIALLSVSLFMLPICFYYISLIYKHNDKSKGKIIEDKNNKEFNHNDSY